MLKQRKIQLAIVIILLGVVGLGVLPRTAHAASWHNVSVTKTIVWGYYWWSPIKLHYVCSEYINVMSIHWTATLPTGKSDYRVCYHWQKATFTENMLIDVGSSYWGSDNHAEMTTSHSTNWYYFYADEDYDGGYIDVWYHDVFQLFDFYADSWLCNGPVIQWYG